MEWYYILGIISYGIFIIQFILSNLGLIDTDLDIDFDGEVDFSVSDLVSFKGLIHFLMGFSGWLMLYNKITAVSVIIAIVMGIAMVIVLYFVYILCMKFKSEPTVKDGTELIGEIVTVYVPNYQKFTCICGLKDGREISCSYSNSYSPGDIVPGDKVKICNYNNGIYYISKN